MSYVNPEPDGEPLFQEATYVDEATKRRRLFPALILAVPMIAAFVLLLFTKGGMNAWAVSGGRLASGQFELLLLYIFAHGGIMHIAFNMMALFVLGPAVMERLGPLESRSLAAFMVLFFGCGLAAVAFWLAINPQNENPMLGASGAIFGLLGFLMRQPDPQSEPLPLLSPAMARAFVEWIKLHIPIILIFVIPMLFGSGFFGLAWEAHLGGFIGGMLLCGPILKWSDGGPDWEPAD